MIIRHYKINSFYTVSDKAANLRIALLTDLHNRPYAGILKQVVKKKPDVIAVAGDITYGFDEYDQAVLFLAECSKIAPTYFCPGNHDNMEDEVFREGIRVSGAVLLDDCFVDHEVPGTKKKIRIGGLSSPDTHHGNQLMAADVEAFRRIRKAAKVNLDWLDEFCDTDECKILLCHQPEFYPRYLNEKEIDVVLSGHAHGGQWRIPFTKQGVYAPGQGFFPKLTGGVIDKKLVISRGLSNTTWIPRFFNPREIVILDLVDFFRFF